MSRILRLEPANQPQNLRSEPEKLERVTYRSKQCDLLAMGTHTEGIGSGGARHHMTARGLLLFSFHDDRPSRVEAY